MVVNEVIPEFVPGAKIKVIWVWGCGNKALNRMIQEGLEGVEFVAVNTDAQDLATNLAHQKVNIGLNITKWLWAGANPDIGRKSAEEDEMNIKSVLADTDMVFITAGMWGGTGTWAAPVVANIAKELGILTVGIVTKPFSFEGKKRAENAEEGLRRMKEVVDTLIVIPNDKIYNLVDKKTTFKQAFTMIDKVLFLGVQGSSDLIIKPGDINIDFADIKNVMVGSGNALLGIGYGAGEKRAVDAAREAIENPLLETNLDGAKKVIFAVSGGNDLTPIEVQEAASIVEEILDPEAEMIWWMSFDESFDDEVKVTIIATGFEEQAKERVAVRTGSIWTTSPIERKAPREAIQKQSDNYITRSLRDTEEIVDPVEKSNTPVEDDDTPAFVRRKMEQQMNGLAN